MALVTRPDAATHADVSATESYELVVTDEYFDYLAAEADRPAAAPDPGLVALVRSVYGTIEHH